jgi:endonuclease YncB( thermonuclease family)
LIGLLARRRGLCLTLALALLAGAGRLLPEAPPSGVPVDTSTGRLRVLDGDTYAWPDGRRVRLPGVDTPEWGRPGAAAAAEFARTRLAGASVALAPSDPPRDRYGRLLADLLVGGESLSLALVAHGHAWVYSSREPALRAAQAAAVTDRRGVHARLDEAGRVPLLASTERFHRADCPWLARSRSARDPTHDVAALLQRGLSPCRTCLQWPP